MRIRIEIRDGQTIAHPLRDDEAWDPRYTAHVDPAVMTAYEAWKAQGAVFDALFGALADRAYLEHEQCASPGCPGTVKARVCDECAAR